MSKKFVWGEQLDRIFIPFTFGAMWVIKYHPYKINGCVSSTEIDESKVLYHCPELSRSAESLESLVLYWIAYNKLGHNHEALVCGIERALGM
jgi:hypothetical protein